MIQLQQPLKSFLRIVNASTSYVSRSPTSELSNAPSNVLIRCLKQILRRQTCKHSKSRRYDFKNSIFKSSELPSPVYANFAKKFFEHPDSKRPAQKWPLQIKKLNSFSNSLIVFWERYFLRFAARRLINSRKNKNKITACEGIYHTVSKNTLQSCSIQFQNYPWAT